MKRFWLLLLFFGLILGLLFALLRYVTCVFLNPDKAWNIAKMVDETCNVGANGEVNETISERAAIARNRGRRWGCILCWILARIQPGHCDSALQDSDAKET